MQLACNEENMDIRSLLARWWKRRVQQNQENSQLFERETNPRTLLNHILKYSICSFCFSFLSSLCRLPSAKQFLKLRIDHLHKDTDSNRKELALCWYLLGDTNEAMDHMQHYLALTDPQSVSSDAKWTAKLIEKQHNILQSQEKLLSVLKGKKLTHYELPPTNKVIK